VKILILVPSLSGGGAEFVAREWATYLVSQGDQVSVALTNPKPEDSIPLSVSTVPASGSLFRVVLGLRAYCRDAHVDAILALMPHWNLLAIVIARSIPASRRPKVVISGRNMARGLRSVFGTKYSVKQWLARRLYRRADAFVAISHPVAAEAIAEYKLDGSAVRVVPNPAMAKVIERGSKDPIARGVRGGGIDIVVPGRLVPQKRPMLALAAAALLSERTPTEVRVHFFGVGPLEASLQNAATDRGVHAFFHGWRRDWFSEAPAGSVVLLASLAEGFGNVLVEAAGSGLPSVASSRCLGAADAIVPGITGELVGGDSAEDYARGIRRASEITISGIESWLDRFSPGSSGAALREVLLDAIGLADMVQAGTPTDGRSK
jgi:glycosyltransferase involved in cell wall biosynthesis